MNCTRMPPEEVRICIAEDNHVNRVLLQKILERQCYTNLVFYEDGKAALEGIKQHAAEGEPFDIVFMDISMPVMDGMRATMLLREDLDKVVREVPIIGMHASSCSPMSQKLSDLGMQDSIKKPVWAAPLSGMVEKYGNPLKPVIAGSKVSLQPRL